MRGVGGQRLTRRRVQLGRGLGSGRGDGGASISPQDPVPPRPPQGEGNVLHRWGAGRRLQGSARTQPTAGQCQSRCCHPGADLWVRDQPGGRGGPWNLPPPSWLLPHLCSLPPPSRVLGLQEGSLLVTAWKQWLWAELLRPPPSPRSLNLGLLPQLLPLQILGCRGYGAGS